MTLTPEQMTIDQLAGQRLMTGCYGTVLDDELRYLIDTLKVGGIILFSRNIQTPAQLEQLCGQIQRYAADCGQPPLFIAVDQEGGEVARLKDPFTVFPGNRSIRDERAADGFARTVAYELASMGINMNMAPVLDVAFDPDTSVMVNRSFGPDPKTVAALGTRVIETLQAQHIIAVAKHFPGIGRTRLDSHDDMPTLAADPEALAEDLLPFTAAIRTPVAAVMLSHILYPAYDPKWPASLSPSVADTLLRQQLGYTGMVITDDLYMGAIRKHFDTPTVAGQIVAANVDMALMCHDRNLMDDLFAGLKYGMSRGGAMAERSRMAVSRILETKAAYL